MPRTRARGSTPAALPWIVSGVLILIGTAVLLARAGPEPTRPGPSPTATAAPAGRDAPALAVVAQPTATIPGAPLRPTVAPTRRPTAPTTPATSATPATPRPTVPPTHAPTQAPATPTAGSTAASASKGLVALTFDAGADRGYAEDILDLLREQHISASFGITGNWARANPDLVRRIAADGHLVINHTLDHQSFTGTSDQRGGLSAARRRAELEEADALIAPLIGHSTRPWYRLPYGDDDAHMAADLAPAGYTRKVGWTVDTLGWRGASATDIVARSLRLAAPGAIYVLHVGHTSQDGPALARLVAGLRERGYGFATVAALPD